MHLYGDIYSSPGISMRQKQLLMAAFLAQANMHDQLFGHLIAVGDPASSQRAETHAAVCNAPLSVRNEKHGSPRRLRTNAWTVTVQAFRFGVQDPEALKAIDMAFELAPAPSSDVYKGAMKTLTLVRVHMACGLASHCAAIVCISTSALTFTSKVFAQMCDEHSHHTYHCLDPESLAGNQRMNDTLCTVLGSGTGHQKASAQHQQGRGAYRAAHSYPRSQLRQVQFIGCSMTLRASQQQTNNILHCCVGMQTIGIDKHGC